MAIYTPPKKILENYANVLINFALNDEKGVKPGQVVLIQVEEPAKAMMVPLQQAVLRAGAHPMLQLLPSGVSRSFYEIASDKQILWFPEKFAKARLDTIDHSVTIIAEDDLHELEGIDPKKIMMHSKPMKNYMRWRDDKENAGKFTWTLALYGTPAAAKEAGMSQKAYWDQIIRACYLNEKNPIAKWRATVKEIHRVRDKLNSMKIEKLHIVAKGTDLYIHLGPDREWMGGRGRNIPSYEVFISPDCRKTEGTITFDQPLYHYGVLIEGVSLTFKNGKVVKATAKKNEKVLKAMIATPGADMVGEYSLTDARLSRINKFMADTLYDENRGGKYGNTHLALGKAYQDSYPGDPSKVPQKKWKAMGYNESVVHTDIVATTRRTVTATLPNGKELVIYKDGKFTF